MTRLGLSMELNASPYNIHEKIFIEGSIFDKTLKLTLGPEKWRMRERVRLDFYRSRVEWAVATGFGSLQLKDEQQRDFVRLIVAETRRWRYGAQDFNAVLIQTARLPRDKLKAIFDDGQWKGLSEMLVHSKELKTTLMWEGYLPSMNRPMLLVTGRRKTGQSRDDGGGRGFSEGGQSVRIEGRRRSSGTSPAEGESPAYPGSHDIRRTWQR